MLTLKQTIYRDLASANVSLKPRQVTYTWMTGFGCRIISISTALGRAQIQAWGEKISSNGQILQFPIWLLVEEIELYVRDGLARIQPDDDSVLETSKSDSQEEWGLKNPF